MKPKIRQKVRGYHMPRYLADILAHDYAESFIHMSIADDNGDVVFSYDTEQRVRIQIDTLTTKDRIDLLDRLLELDTINEDHLIPGNIYMIEPELLYVLGGEFDSAGIRLLFFPDSQRKSFLYKWALMAAKVLRADDAREEDLLSRIRRQLELSGDREKLHQLMERTRRRVE